MSFVLTNAAKREWFVLTEQLSNWRDTTGCARQLAVTLRWGVGFRHRATRFAH
jgi:hypothetical protein